MKIEHQPYVVWAYIISWSQKSMKWTYLSNSPNFMTSNKNASWISFEITSYPNKRKIPLSTQSCRIDGEDIVDKWVKRNVTSKHVNAMMWMFSRHEKSNAIHTSSSSMKRMKKRNEVENAPELKLFWSYLERNSVKRWKRELSQTAKFVICK